MADTRTHVTFNSTAFNASVTRHYFVNPGNYGDDLARWLMRELRRQGFEVEEELGQEDYGWYFTLECDDAQYTCVVGHRDEEDSEWVVWIERSVGVFASLYRPRTARVLSDVAQTIHEVLISSELIHNVRWHFEEDFLAGREDRGEPEPG